MTAQTANTTETQEPKINEENDAMTTTTEMPTVTATVIQVFDKPRKCGDCQRKRKVSKIEITFSTDPSDNIFTCQLCSECLENRSPVQAVETLEDFEETVFTVVSGDTPIRIVTGIAELDGTTAEPTSEVDMAAIDEQVAVIGVDVPHIGVMGEHSPLCLKDFNLRCNNCGARICRWECPSYRNQPMSEWQHHRAECVEVAPEPTPEPTPGTEINVAPKPRRQRKAAATTEPQPEYTGHVGPQAGVTLPRIFTEEIRLEIAEQAKLGTSEAQLAAAWGRSVASIGKIVKRLGS